MIFLYTIHLMKSGHTSLTVVFVVVYLLAAVLQVRGTNPLKSQAREWLGNCRDGLVQHTTQLESAREMRMGIAEDDAEKH